MFSACFAGESESIKYFTVVFLDSKIFNYISIQSFDFNGS